MADVPKVERDGRVAVLVSPDYGAGWTTWMSGEHRERALFDPAIVAEVEAGRDPTPVAQRLYPDEYCGGVSELRVEWVTKGQRFRIHEYDGAESLEIIGPDYGYTA